MTGKIYFKDLKKMSKWKRTFILENSSRLPSLKKPAPKKKFCVEKYLGNVDKYVEGKPKFVKR